MARARLDGLGVAQVALNLAGHPSLGADGQDRRHRVELGQEARRLACGSDRVAVRVSRVRLGLAPSRL
eukprot:844494-Prymnesium_polylepis.1